MDEGSLFGLKFSEGYIFLEVTGWEQVKFEPYDNIGTVSADVATNYQNLNDSSGDDILYVEKGDEKVIHAGIGMEPGFIRRYTNYPEGENRLRAMPNLGTPTAGDNYGFVDGTDSPYDNPTDAEELLIPPGMNLDFSFYNPDSREREPVLNILSRVYNIRPLNPSNREDSQSISRIVSPGSPMPIHPVGSVRNQARYVLGEEWGVQPISRSAARRE